ncbi:uncharacterized protein LOC110893438 [Helianthus annuus]|uniref:uncharacterized protein LOC110893438 n=1 Tax=Helianthus annuus TaxID=4232 RepID=UPI000B8F5305|nr:uncharacterized protein LOC110893438 [Helianthus annuus]
MALFHFGLPDIAPLIPDTVPAPSDSSFVKTFTAAPSTADVALMKTEVHCANMPIAFLQGIPAPREGKENSYPGERSNFDDSNPEDCLPSSIVKKIYGIAREYVDHGDAIFVCSYCHAMLWKDEMLRGNLDSKKSSFSLCCSNGDVELPSSPSPPPLLERFYKRVTPESRNFMNNIRTYNMMFSFTSLGGKVSKTFQKTKGPYVFGLQGQNYHRIGSLLPNDGEEPKFSQLYIYDSQNEDFNSQKAVRCLKDKRLNPQDRPDIISRLFKIKINHLIQDFKKHKFFGGIQAIIYTIEFQKRGLPHAHICLFLSAESKFPMTKEIDSVISAEIPDKEMDAELYELVKQFMIHGPCGTDNPHCPCMVNLKCSKKFLKKYVDETCVDSEGYPVYRRRQSCNTIEKHGVLLDNRFVVPYNAMLLKKYQCHINVEWCNQTGSIKYLFKYINKGPDRVTASVYESTTTANVNHQNEEMTNNENLSNETEVNEGKAYLDCRYISACEAAWRILKFDIHYRFPSVEILPFHCEDGQAIVYDDNSNLCDVVSNPTVKMSMFTEWMKCNQTDAFARTLKHIEFPRYFVWICKTRKWVRRKKPFGAVGMIHYVPPSLGDCYFLRILLNHVIGPMSFNDIKTVDGKIYHTFKDACFAHRLLDDDKEYLMAINEASTWATSDFLRTFFVMLLMSNSISRSGNFWMESKSLLCEDILYQQRRITGIADLVLPGEEIENIFLSHIEKLLLGYGSTLSNFFDMPNELSYDRAILKKELAASLKSLTDEQRKVYETVMNAVVKGSGGVFFLYGYGGTGKTFPWKTFAVALRSNGEVVLNVASSGIASLLLDGGRTAHSRFVIPINVNEDSICSIEPNSELGGLIKETKMIIWDEAPMTHKHCFEALDRTMRDIAHSSNPSLQNKPFGGKIVLFGGDFRQILPVIPKGTRSMIVNSSLNSSYIWQDCQLLKLIENMRLKMGTKPSNFNETKEFAEWIIKLGDGLLGGPNDGEVEIEIPDDLLILDAVNPISSLIAFTYPDMQKFFMRFKLLPTKSHSCTHK